MINYRNSNKIVTGVFLGFLVSLVLAAPSMGGVKVIDYGFEDWVGFDGNNSPAPNYVFSTSYSSYWQEHMDGTGVLAACNSDTAFEGKYFFHKQFYTGEVDSCIGTLPTSVNARANLGTGGLAYPTGEKNTVNFNSAISSNTLVLRLYMRCTGNWTSSQSSTLDSGAGLKFMRLYGGNGVGDDSSILLKLLNDGDDVDPRFLIFNPETSKYSNFRTGINWQDGQWHSIVVRVVRNNDINSTNNITLTFWIDDWDMLGAGYSQDITVPDMGSKFQHIAFMGNWSAKHPTSNIAIDIDKLEVWDGLPDGASDNAPNIIINDPSTPTFIASSNTIDLAGTSSDDNGVSSVTWSNNRGGSGTVSGSLASWSLTGITLMEGDNVITVTARDTAGQTSSDTITVSYDPLPALAAPQSVNLAGQN